MTVGPVQKIHDSSLGSSQSSSSLRILFTLSLEPKAWHNPPSAAWGSPHSAFVQSWVGQVHNLKCFKCKTLQCYSTIVKCSSECRNAKLSERNECMSLQFQICDRSPLQQACSRSPESASEWIAVRVLRVMKVIHTHIYIYNILYVYL